MGAQQTSKSRLASPLLPIIIVLAGVAAAGLIFFWPDRTPGQDGWSLTNCTGDSKYHCYQNRLGELTNTKNPKAAFKKIREVYETDPDVKSLCHQLTHVIGHAAYEKYGSIAEAYRHGDGLCWSGYYHGITEKAIVELGAEYIKEQANNLCAELAESERYSFDHYNCVHGLGHGFLTVEKANLFDALKACDLLTDDWERESCYGGVYMENVMIEARGEGKSAYLRPEEPLYPCTAVEQDYKYQCYLMQTSYVLRQNGYNFADTFQACHDMGDQSFITTCYTSIGRDASGSTVSDIAATKRHCSHALDYSGLEHCLIGAALDFVSYFHDDSQAKALCETFGPPHESRCLQEVAVYYDTF